MKMEQEIQQQQKLCCYLCMTACDSVCPYCKLVGFCCDAHFRLHRLDRRKPDPENSDKDCKDEEEDNQQGYCSPYKASFKPGIGRILVATRNIRPLELIMVDPGAVVGPNYSSPHPVCIECLTPAAKRSTSCPLCHYPMCCQACSTRKVRHTDRECQILSRCPLPTEPAWSPEALSFITPLRLMLLLEQGGDQGQRSDQLMDHLEESQSNAEDWSWYEDKIVDHLLKTLRLENEFSPDQVRRAIGLINVNSVAVRFQASEGGPAHEDQGQPEGKGLYPIFAIMSHHCICNARYSLSPGSLLMYVRARQPIPAGQEITVQYLSALSGNFKRREKIRRDWFFDCRCRRCSDPTECGTSISAIKCDSCYLGNLLPIDSLDYKSAWKCDSCYSSKTMDMVSSLVDLAEEELERIRASGDYEQYAEFIETYSDVLLHPHHYLMMTASRNLIQFYTYSKEKQLDSETLQRKHDLCQTFDAVLSKIDPGFSEIRNFVQKELHFTTLLVCQRDFEAGRISRTDFLAVSRRCFRSLEENARQSRLLKTFPFG